MSGTNRFANRLVLALVGLVLLVGAVAGALLVTQPAWASFIVDPANTVLSDARGFAQHELQLSGLGTVPVGVVIAAAVALVLIILLLVFLATRGGGATETVARVSSDAGRTAIDASIVDAVLGETLRSRKDVLAAKTKLRMVKRQPVIRLDITPRRGTDLPSLLADTESAVRDWDTSLGSDVPVLVHFRDRGFVAARRDPSRVR